VLEFLRVLTELLEQVGVPYMLAGSVASSYHGEPRATQDIDLVVALTLGSVRRLFAQLDQERFYMDRDTAMSAVRSRSQFNIIDMESGWKCDLIIVKGHEFAQTEFKRRVRVDLEGVPVWVASAEDVVLSKLVWAKRSGGSARQHRDARSVLGTASSELDRDYLRRWAAELGVAAELSALESPGDGD